MHMLGSACAAAVKMITAPSMQGKLLCLPCNFKQQRLGLEPFMIVAYMAKQVRSTALKYLSNVRWQA
jgi:hypothetical protein